MGGWRDVTLATLVGLKGTVAVFLGESWGTQYLILTNRFLKARMALSMLVIDSKSLPFSELTRCTDGRRGSE